MAKKITSALLIFLLLIVPVITQIPQNNITFTFVGLTTGSAPGSQTPADIDIQLLESRIKTVLLEIARQEKYGIVFPQKDTLFLKAIDTGNKDQIRDLLPSQGTILSANGFVSARLQTLPGSILFEIKLYDSPNFDEVMKKTITVADMDSLINEVEGPFYEVFGLISPEKNLNIATDLNTAGSSNLGAYLREKDLKISDLTGTWQGDYGLSKIQVSSDGTAIAYLNDKDTIKLRMNMLGQTVQFIQDEPNSPKLYLNIFPFSIASQIVRVARPMSWEFSLSIEKDRLVGKKNTSYFYIEQGNIVQVDNTYSREAIWVRIP